MPEKRKEKSKKRPEKVFEVGQCYAQVHRAVSNAGFCYRYFELGRQWETATGKRVSATSFFAEHNAEIAECVRLASHYIAEAKDRPV
jgi:hypothetical protein